MMGLGITPELGGKNKSTSSFVTLSPPRNKLLQRFQENPVKQSADSRLQVGGKTNPNEQNETMRTRPVQPASGLLAATSGNFRARTPVKDTALAVRDAVFMNFNFLVFFSC